MARRGPAAPAFVRGASRQVSHEAAKSLRREVPKVGAAGLVQAILQAPSPSRVAPAAAEEQEQDEDDEQGGHAHELFSGNVGS
jgi:hypothetical protein